jgi:hypothetical protein
MGRIAMVDRTDLTDPTDLTAGRQILRGAQRFWLIVAWRWLPLLLTLGLAMYFDNRRCRYLECGDLSPLSFSDDAAESKRFISITSAGVKRKLRCIASISSPERASIRRADPAKASIWLIGVRATIRRAERWPLVCPLVRVN